MRKHIKESNIYRNEETTDFEIDKINQLKLGGYSKTPYNRSSKKFVKEAYGWANDYWHDYATKDSFKKDIIDYIYNNDLLQCAYDYYKNNDKDALYEIVSSYLDSHYEPMDVYKSLEGKDGFGIRNNLTGELIYSSKNNDDIENWLDNNEDWGDEEVDYYMPIVKNAINEIGYYNFNNEDEIDESCRRRKRR